MNFNENVIVFDVETTGLSCEYDEILQLSIINGNGKVLFDNYFKPEHKRSWKEAEKINHISPEKVKYKRKFSFYRKQIQSIFSNAKVIIAYNANFDIQFLKAAGIDVMQLADSKQIELFENLPPITKKVLDPMIDFSQNVSKKWSNYYHDYIHVKLEIAAGYYGYYFNPHNSLDDVKATLFLAKELYR